jgi:hypothetical protein
MQKDGTLLRNSSRSDAARKRGDLANAGIAYRGCAWRELTWGSGDRAADLQDELLF